MSRRRKKKQAYIIAVIGASAVVIAAIIGIFHFDLSSCIDNGSGGISDTSEVPTEIHTSDSSREILNTVKSESNPTIDPSNDGTTVEPNSSSETNSPNSNDDSIIHTTPPTTPNASSSGSNTGVSHTTPSSTTNGSKTNGGSIPDVPPEIQVLENDFGKIKFFSSCSGEAYIYKKYLNQNQIGTILPNEHDEICGWDFTLLYNNTAKFCISIKPVSNDKKQFEGSLWCIKKTSDESLYNYEGQITVQSAQNGDIIISFNAAGLPIDLRNATDIAVTNSYPPHIYIDTSETQELSDKDDTLNCSDGMVEFYNDHSGVALIYKNYLYNNPIGSINEFSGFETIGWSISVFDNTKSFSFNITQSQTAIEVFECTAQYDIDNEVQEIYLEQIYTQTDENGNLKIEFNINNLPFDLRTLSGVKVMGIVQSNSYTN